jgi:hypothetical protein
MWIENHEGKIRLAVDGKAYKPLIDLREDDHTPKKPRFQRYIEWIYYVYSEELDNPYKNYFPEERKKQVIEREFGADPQYTPEKFDKKLEDLVREYVYLHTSDTERLIIGVQKKIQKFLEFFNDTDIDHENYQDIQKRILSTTGLIQYRETLEKEKKKDEAKWPDGKRPRLFELPT